MIYFNQHKSWKSVHFNGHNIIGVYNSLGKVWPESAETIYRWVKTDETTCVEDAEVIYRYIQTDETTCVEDEPTPTGTWVSYQSGDTFTGNEKIGGIRISLEEATRLMDIEDYYGDVYGSDDARLEPILFAFAVVQSEGKIIGNDGEDIPLVDGYFTLTLDNTKEWKIEGTRVFEERYVVPPYPVPFNCDLLIKS